MPRRWSIPLLFSLAGMLATQQAGAQQLLDDFNRADNAVVGAGWLEGGIGSQGNITGNELWFTNPTGLNGRDWVSRDVNGLYNTVLSVNACVLTWAFNMRLNRPAPSGLDNGEYGIGFVLGGTNADPGNGSGYAVVVGNSLTPDPVRLIRYTGGLSNVAMVTLLSFPIVDRDFLNVRVTFDPSTGIWEMFVENSATGPYTNPLVGGTSAGTVVDVTHVNSDLRHVACLYQHNTGTMDNARFDNVYVPSLCSILPPTLNFTTPPITDLENSGPKTFQLNVLPAAPMATTVTITITTAGAVYASDFTTVPSGAGGFFTLNIPANTSLVSFTANIINDIIPEPLETVTFTITGASASLVVGPAFSRVLTIVDDDAPPTVLLPGDLAIVGINANNGACSGQGSEDEVSFFCFKDILPGTEIDMTDNGFSRAVTGLWGEVEGTVRMKRLGPTIPAGTVISFRFRVLTGANNVVSVAPDAFWSCTSLNGATNLNLNSGGDQIFFMQGGTWNNPVGADNSTYTGGSILFGFSTNGLWLPLQNSNQHSALPTGIDCFSTAPTSTSDFTKYTGPTTPATQRAWIIRVDSPTNWTTYGTCAAYNAGPPNYLLAPVMPITVASFTNGLWTGAVSTSWYDCRNWDDAEVPTATSNVVVDQTAIRSCEVDNSVTPGYAITTASCASVSVSSTGTTVDLRVKNGNSLVVGGPVSVNNTGSATPMGVSVLNGTLTANSLTMQGWAPGSGLFVNETPGNTVQIYGPVSILSGGTLDLSGAVVGGTLSLAGNFVNNGGAAGFTYLYSTVTFNGTGAQSVNTLGAVSQSFDALRMLKPTGDLTLNCPITVAGPLDLTSGRIFSTGTNLMTMGLLSSVSNSSNASFVHGPMQKIGPADFQFPIGKANVNRPVALTANTGTLTDAFIAEYFQGDPSITIGVPIEATLDHISQCEWWTIDRTAGSANAYVSLSWAPASCGVTNMSHLRVARWDGAIWRDRGNGGTFGSLVIGTIITPLQQTLFSPWTLASISTQNPLPVELLWFTATPTNREVLVQWSTATERDNAFFTVERSSDALEFKPIATVDGAGNSQSTLHYHLADPAPLPGASYYRLRQTDLDGNSSLSDVVAVHFSGNAPTLSLRPLGDGLFAVVHDLGASVRGELIDALGRTRAIGLDGSDGNTQLNVAGLARGTYVLRITDGSHAVTARFVH